MVRRIKKWNYCLLEVENPTDNQLVYMKDLYSKEILIEWLLCRWTDKFNYGTLKEKDIKLFHKQCGLLNINSFEVLSQMEDYFLI